MTENKTNACKVEWFTIPSPDLKQAKSFYGEIFGWTFEEYSPTYIVFKTGNISGGLVQEHKPQEGGISVSITVDDITETLKHIQNAGGEIVVDKMEIAGGFGHCAVFKDPNGNQLELWSK